VWVTAVTAIKKWTVNGQRRLSNARKWKRRIITRWWTEGGGGVELTTINPMQTNVECNYSQVACNIDPTLSDSMSRISRSGRISRLVSPSSIDFSVRGSCILSSWRISSRWVRFWPRNKKLIFNCLCLESNCLSLFFWNKNKKSSILSSLKLILWGKLFWMRKFYLPLMFFLSNLTLDFSMGLMHATF